MQFNESVKCILKKEVFLKNMYVHVIDVLLPNIINFTSFYIQRELKNITNETL